VKMNRSWLAVALLLTTISLPATLLAKDKSDGPAKPVVHKPVLSPDGNPFPHMIGGRR
jgi:hypothetical protein